MYFAYGLLHVRFSLKVTGHFSISFSFPLDKSSFITFSYRATNNEDQGQQQQLDITSGLEFTSLHSTSDDGLDSLKVTSNSSNIAAPGEETRGPRAKNPEPGRTYECELWCRDASRQLAGCMGFTLLILTYAVRLKQKEFRKRDRLNAQCSMVQSGFYPQFLFRFETSSIHFMSRKTDILQETIDDLS